MNVIAFAPQFFRLDVRYLVLDGGRQAGRDQDDMTEQHRPSPDTETPVNPYSLLEAVNSSSDAAHTAWMLFLGLMTYLMIAVAGVTHKDLLLETAVALPLLQVSIPQSQFFKFAPVVLVLMHLGLVSQLVLLARKTLEFDQSVQLLEVTERRSHPLRLELHNFFFVQAVAGPHRSLVMSAFLHAMSWLSLVVFPVILLLFIQISYLPFHDVMVTWTNRVALMVDISVLVLIGVFLTRAETSFPLAFWRTTRDHPLTIVSTGGLLAATGFFSLFVATIPGEPLDKLLRRVTGQAESSGGPEDRASTAQNFALPFLSARSDGTLFGMFSRNIIATDLDLAPAKDGKSESGIALRNRDLRFAKLDRTDFRGADLTTANLDGASLVGAELTGVRMQCADVSSLYLSDKRDAARCVSARNANFTRARMKDARLAGIDAGGAKFEEAILEAADFSYAILTGANFASAHLEGADFSGGAQLQGANFLIAFLQGADLSGASLLLAEFSSAQLHGAVLAHADLKGALLRGADLEGADLGRAKLQGADFSRAKLRASDFRGASIWMTLPPGEENLQFADLSELVVRPLEEGDAGQLIRTIAALAGSYLQVRMREALSPIMNTAATQPWANSSDNRRWQTIASASTSMATSPAYKTTITDQLGQMSCKPRWSNGAVATRHRQARAGPEFSWRHGRDL